MLEEIVKDGETDYKFRQQEEIQDIQDDLISSLNSKGFEEISKVIKRLVRFREGQADIVLTELRVLKKLVQAGLKKEADIMKRLDSAFPDGDIRGHREEHESFPTKMAEIQQKIDDGFPNGDASGHRRVHEDFMDKTNKRSTMYEAVATQIVKGVVWIVIAGIGLAMWESFRTHLTG